MNSNKTTVIKNVSILTVDAEMNYYLDRAILIENGRIKAFIPNQDVNKLSPDTHVIDANGMVAMPGLVNTHMHSNLVRGFGDNMELYVWHDRVAELVGHNTTPAEAHLGALVSYAEALKAGTTTILGLEKYAPRCYDAALEVGIRARLVPYILDFDDCEDTVELNIEYVEKTNTPDARVRFWFGFDSFREAGPDMIRNIANLSEKYDTPMQTHSNESIDDVKLCIELHGMTPIEYLDSLGALTNRTVLAHGVHLSEEEKQLMEKSGAKIAHCIISNMKLNDGIAPIREYIDRGIDIGLGTDGANSNNNYDLFEEIKAATLLQRISTNSASAFTAEEALRLATIEGARVLGMENEIGSLEVGKCADIILINMSKLHCMPYDTRFPSTLVSNLVYSVCGADVHTVLVGGDIVMENRQLKMIDEEALIKEAKIVGRELMDKLIEHGLEV